MAERASLEKAIGRLEEELDLAESKLTRLQTRCPHPAKKTGRDLGEYWWTCEDCGGHG